MLFLGIDSGTQSTKGVVLDLEAGQLVAQSSRAYDLIPNLPDGHMEQHPSDWIAAVDHVISDCINQLGERKSQLKGIGVSGQQHGFVPMDGQGEVIRPAKLWCDTSTTDQCAQFAAKFGGAAGLIELSGNTVLPGYTVPKILWLKQREPGNFASMKSFLLPHDYINFWLTGLKQMEFGDASGTGLLNIHTREWCKELADFVDPSLFDLLPPLKSSRGPIGGIREELRKNWGLGDDVVVSAGGGDNMMGAIGTGNVRQGVVTMSLGTSGTVYGVSETPIIDKKGEVAAFCDSTDLWMPLLCTMNVTVVTEQVRSLFGWDLDRLNEEAAGAEPGAGGLTFLPYLTGERTPNYPDASGVLHGMRTHNLTPAHLARAGFEGATLGLAYGLKRFKELGLTPSEIRLTGGGSKSAFWRQLISDATGVPTVCLKSAEGAALGAAIQAAHAYLSASSNGSSGPSYDELTTRLVELDPATRCQPDPGATKIYAAQLDRQQELGATMHGAGLI